MSYRYDLKNKFALFPVLMQCNRRKGREPNHGPSAGQLPRAPVVRRDHFAHALREP
jgi:hypothetical protein